MCAKPQLCHAVQVKVFFLCFLAGQSIDGRSFTVSRVPTPSTR